MIIMGVDPGVAKSGFGVISKIKSPCPASLRSGVSRWAKSKTQNRLRCLGYGVIQTSPNLSPAERLKILYLKILKLINKYRPKVLAVESVYFFKNLKTALPVSQAKGVILLAAAQKKIPVFEFSPLQIKMVISGYGKAEKRQIQRMIKVLLDLKEIPAPDDASDALAVAICYAISH